MPIPVSTASMAMSIVNGLVRLTGRVDRIMAEQAALRTDLAIGSKILLKPPLAGVMKQKLQALTDETKDQVPDPLADKRAEITALVAKRNPGEPELLKFMQLFLPDEIEYRLDDPNGNIVDDLKLKRETWNLDDEDIMRVAYYLQPGEDLRKASTTWQIAMSVVEVLADFAIENQSLFLRDGQARPLLLAILQRFADADLAEVGSHRVFLRVVLKTTMNGALDVPNSLDSDKVWVDCVLNALADTRESEGDDFVVGLLNGKSYPVLVGNLLEEGAEMVGVSAKDNAKHFEAIASDVLKHAAEVVKQRDDFEGFVSDHWGDLLRAGLKSFHANGDAILEEQPPLLSGALLSAIDVLAESPDRNFLSSETLTATIEAAIAAVVVKPELLEGVTDKEWIKQLISSTAKIVNNQGIRQAVSSEGVDIVIRDTLDFLAQQPELLVRKPGLSQDVVGVLLDSLAKSGSLRLETIAVTGVRTLLNELAANPDLVDTNYPQVVSEIAGLLAETLSDLRLTRDEAEEMLVSLAEMVAANPALVVSGNVNLPARVLEEVLGVLINNRGKPLSSNSIKVISVKVLDIIAADTGLLAGSPDLVKQSVTAVLDEITRALHDSGAEPSLRFEHLAVTALNSVLVSVAADPALLKNNVSYPRAMGHLAGVLANALKEGQLNDREVEQILIRAGEIIATNAQLLANEQNELVARVTNVVLAKISDGSSVTLRGDAVSEILTGTIKVLAANVKLLQKAEESVEQLVKRVQVAIAAGLDKAQQKLGLALEQSDIPPVVVELLRRWARDELPSLDIDDEGFNSVFDEIVGAMAGQIT